MGGGMFFYKTLKHNLANKSLFVCMYTNTNALIDKEAYGVKFFFTLSETYFDVKSVTGKKAF